MVLVVQQSTINRRRIGPRDLVELSQLLGSVIEQPHQRI
jgi:hypothetical protein